MRSNDGAVAVDGGANTKMRLTKTFIFLFAIALGIGAIAVVARLTVKLGVASDPGMSESRPSADLDQSPMRADETTPPQLNLPSSVADLVKGEISQGDVPMLELLENNAAEIAKLAEGFNSTTSATLQTVDRTPLWWSEVNPGQPFLPEKYSQLTQKLTLTEGAASVTQIGIILQIHEHRAVARHAAMYSAFGQAELPPKTAIPLGTPSGFPLGEGVWSSRQKAADVGQGWPTFRLTAYDGLVSLRLDIAHQPKDAAARQLEFEPITESDIRLGESLARVALSCGIRASLRFDKLPESSLQIKSGAIATKLVPSVGRLASVNSVAQLIGVSPAKENGIWTFTCNGKLVVIPVASRTVSVGDKTVSSRLPVISENGTVWIDLNTLLRLTGLKKL